jgi:hypothetical protein
MKKRYSLLTGLLLAVGVFFTQQVSAQAPPKMSYQSLIRNSSNALLTNTTVGMKISVLQGSDSGDEVYVETQTATTNANGLLSIQVGSGTTTTGTFSDIDWATGPYFIKTETDPSGGTNYTIIGTQELMSVPYAMYAAKSGESTTMGPIGDSSTDNGGTIESGVLSLTPADRNNGGVVTYGPQDFDGNKSFYGDMNIYNTGNSGSKVKIYNNNNTFTNPIGTNINIEGYLSYAGIPAGNYPLYSTADINPGLPDNNANPTVTFDNLTALHLTSPINYFDNNTSNWWALLTDGDVKVNGKVNTSGTYTAGAVTYPNTHGDAGQVLSTTGEGTLTWVSPQAGLALFEPTEDYPDAIHNTNAGNVGIGTDLPSEKLDVAGNLRVRDNATIDGVLIANEIQSREIKVFRIRSEELNVFRIQSEELNANRIRSGTLDINGDLRIGGGDPAQGKVLTSDENGRASWQNPVSMAFKTTEDDADAIHNTNAGNVGIGTDLPSEKLDVAGNLKVRDNATINGVLYAYEIYSKGLNVNRIQSEGLNVNRIQSETLVVNGDLRIGGGDPARGKVLTSDENGRASWENPVTQSMVFETTLDDANAIYNTNPGNVGIGTDLPSEKLDVAGNLRVRGRLNDMNVGNLGTGSGNVIFGKNAYNNSASGDDNTIIGNGAMANSTTGNNSVAVGMSALQNNTTGYWNNSIGFGSLVGNTTGYQNIGLGFGTLSTNTTGSQNTAIGNQANVSVEDLTNATAIGNGALVDASNKIQLGNEDVTAVNTSGTYTGAGFKTPTGTSYQYLMADGSVSDAISQIITAMQAQITAMQAQITAMEAKIADLTPNPN